MSTRRVSLKGGYGKGSGSGRGEALDGFACWNFTGFVGIKASA